MEYIISIIYIILLYTEEILHIKAEANVILYS